MSNLAALTDQLQALLMDDGTLFPDASCTAAIRQALRTYNTLLPNTGATTIDVVSGQLVYELTEALAGTEPLSIIGIYLEDATGGDNDTPLPADVYSEDNRLFFRLKAASSGTTLIARYTLAHTVDDLDSATETTLSAFEEPTLLDAAAASLCRMAASGVIESLLLNPKTADNYGMAADRFEKAFDLGIQGLRLNRQPPKQIPAARGWSDQWTTYRQ